MKQFASAAWFAERLGDRTTRGIALETSALIRVGVLPVGTKLPPVRDLAFALDVSPATISEAWSELRRQKVITGRGRNGTWVSSDRFVSKPERLADSGHYGADVVDLRSAGPDPSLLPPLGEALAHGAVAHKLNSYERCRILPELEDAVRQRWPYEPGAFLATNGGYNAVYAAVRALILPGSVVAIEDPTAMRLLDILEDLGVQILPLSCDHDGPLPASLATALMRRPAAVLFQPRLHSVTGRHVSPERLEALGEALVGSDALIIEDDGIGDISAAPPATLGHRFPDRVVHILSYSKSLGPDLRLAVLSSSAAIVDQIQSYRSFSAGWTSRALQGAVAWLLRDPATDVRLQFARSAYQGRRDALADALVQRGIAVPPGDGLCLYLPVSSETFAMVTLAAQGVAVHPGAKFSTLPTRFIRAATSTLTEALDVVADAMALACAAGHDR